jgi:hypothetical protein
MTSLSKCNKLPYFYDDTISIAATYKEIHAYGKFAHAVWTDIMIMLKHQKLLK